MYCAPPCDRSTERRWTVTNERCKYSDDCFRPCGHKQSFLSGFIIYPLPCYASEQPDAKPQMMICPKTSTCRLCVSRGEPHKHNDMCKFENDFCPTCIPAEQPTYPACPHCGHQNRPVCCIPIEPMNEPAAPVDLDAVRRGISDHGSGFVAADVARRMCDEIERLRDRRDASRKHWQNEYRKMHQRRDDVGRELVDALERLRRMTNQRDTYRCTVGNLRAENDKLRETVESVRALVVERDDDEVTG